MDVSNFGGFKVEDLEVGESFEEWEGVGVEDFVGGGGEQVYVVLGNLRPELDVCGEGEVSSDL